MAKRTVENEQMDAVQNPVDKYQKPLTIAGVILIAITFGYVGFTRFYLEPQQEKGSADMFEAEKWFGKDSFALALNGVIGDQGFAGFEDIAKEYGMTDAGNVAHYYAGICNLNLGSTATDSVKAVTYFENAADHLKNFKTDSRILGPMGLGATGDALCELSEFAEAAAYYQKAASADDNEYTASMYLKKAGFVYEKLGQYDKAVTAYKKIKSDYGKTTVGTSIDKYISRAENH